MLDLAATGNVFGTLKKSTQQERKDRVSMAA